MKRRILYLHDIVNRKADELTTMIVEAQREKSHPGDFYPQVMEDMDRLEISYDDMAFSKDILKTKVKNRAKECALAELLEKAKNHSKVREEIYTNLEGASHYKSPRFTPDLTNMLFRFRTRTFMVKNNFRNNYKNTNTLCPLCNEHEDDQSHILQCHKIQEVYKQEVKCKIEDVFSNDEEVLYSTACTLKELVEIRSSLLDQDE